MSQLIHDTITFYGATWCPDCNVSKKFLDDNAIEYTYVNLEEKPEAAEEVEKINNGFQSIPTIVFKDGTSLTEPTNEEIAQKLGLKIA